MIGRMTILAIALALATLVTPAIAGPGDEPAAYAQRVPIKAVEGASLQRIDLPARVLIASRNPDLADLRIFNAQGEAVPIALSTAQAPRQRQSTALTILPIMGAADALSVTGVSLRLDDRQRARVVQVEGTPQQSASSRLLGILLDTRRIEEAVSAIALEVATPAGQPVTFTVESSTDLKEWEQVADKVVYRANGNVGSASIGFPAWDLRGRYLRVTWNAASRLLAPVVVKSASAVTMRAENAQMPRVQIAFPPLTTAHVIEFTLPFAAPVEALEINPVGTDTVLPIRISGRNQSEGPWTLIASGSLFRVTRDGRSRVNPAFDLRGARFRTLRIEADARTDGFGITPLIAARLQPAQVVFLASGPAPFTLATGRADAQPAFLPLGELAKASGADTKNLPSASVAPEADPVVEVLAAEHGLPWRKVALWAVLLAATALLAAMVWLLMRRREPAPLT